MAEHEATMVHKVIDYLDMNAEDKHSQAHTEVGRE